MSTDSRECLDCGRLFDTNYMTCIDEEADVWVCKDCNPSNETDEIEVSELDFESSDYQQHLPVEDDYDE